MTALRRDRTQFTREAQKSWRASQDRPPAPITRRPGEDVDSYSRALIALDEAGYRYAGDEYAPGATVRLFQPTSAFTAHEDITISGWNMVIKARPDTYTVWVPTLEELVAESFQLLGKDTEWTFEQCWYAAHGPETARPLPVFSDGPCVATIKDVTHGVGTTFRAAATVALADVYRRRCPHCFAVSEGRQVHEGSCPALIEEAL